MTEAEHGALAGLSPLLDARLSAQRRVLAFLLQRLSPDDQAAALAAFDQPYPPQDHQEDPGAVSTEAFGFMTAFAAEMRAILKPLKDERTPPR
jgi:hypothetical protein